MLLGTYQNKLDDKLRLTIPAKMRGQLGSVVYISKGFEGSLEVRSAEEYEKWVESILSLQNMSNKARLIQREILGNSIESEIDSSGRIKLTSSILKLSGITKEVVVLGVGSKAELWDKEKYNEYMNCNSSNLEDIANELSGYDF